MEFSSEDIVEVFNTIGFESKEDAVQTLSLAKSFIAAGFDDPTVFTPVVKRLKLIDQKLKLETQAAILQAAQQQQIQQLVTTTNPAIGVVNDQINQINAQLAQLQA